MKTKTQFLASALLAALTVISARGQGFDTGSDGSLGALNVTDADVTVDLPPDGRLHYTTVNVAAGRTLRFNRNALNTPVQLLAQGNIEIAGVVEVNGQTAPSSPRIGGPAGPGGFDGGKPGFGAEFPPGDGYGPGGGGAHPTDFRSSGGAGHLAGGGGGIPGAAYGSPLLIPLMGGSGGGGQAGSPGTGGGGGGGAILLASNTRITVSLGARILAMGAIGLNFQDNGGSGGAIRLLAPRIEGTGELSVIGGSGGSAGRIRVDTLDKTSVNLIFTPGSHVATFGANLFVAPSTLPRLDLVNAAGTDIPLGTGNTVQVQLPFNSDTNRTVTIRAQDFNADVPIRVTLTPDSGSRTVIDTNIVNTAQNPATLVIPVSLPVNNLVTIHAWTR